MAESKESKDAIRQQQYATPVHLNVRNWFNTQLPKLGGDAFEYVGQLLTQLKIVGPERKISVAELGCGTGVFWDKNPTWPSMCQRIVLTDFSSGMIEACQKKPWVTQAQDRSVVASAKECAEQIQVDAFAMDATVS